MSFKFIFDLEFEHLNCFKMKCEVQKPVSLESSFDLVMEKTSPIYSYFAKDIKDNKRLCNYCPKFISVSLNSCSYSSLNQNFLQNFVTNLKNHLKSNHNKKFATFEQEQKLYEEQKQSKKRHIERGKDEGPLPKQPRIDVAFDQTLEDCVELVTAHGIPFSTFDHAAMRQILKRSQPKVSNCKEPNTKNVREEVLRKSKMQVAELKRVLKGQMISLKIDFATCQSRSFFGVTAQFFSQNKVFFRKMYKCYCHKCQELHQISTGFLWC
jgi:BED zinc finger